MPGAFYTGIVKNQQGSETELLQIGRSEKLELPNFSQSRDKASGESTERAARLAIRRRRIYGGFARRQTRAFSRYREKSAGFRNGTVTNQQK
jgi:hypothetical protein